MAGYTSDDILFEIETATAGVYATLGQVISVDPPEVKRNFVEPRVMGQPYPIVMTTSMEAQNVTLNLLFDPDNTDHAAFETALDAKTSKKYRITYNDTSPKRREYMTAIVESFKVDELTAEGKEVTATVVLKLTSKRTLTAPA
jgi:hypothetical protein